MVSDTLVTVGVSAVVAGAVNSGFRMWGDSWFLRVPLKQEHQQKQRERLQDLIGEYHGRMLEAAVDWDRRMSQFYDENSTSPS